MSAGILAIVSTVITSLLPFAIKLITYFIDKRATDIQTKKKFLDFIESLDSDLQAPARIRRSVKKQRDKLDAMLAEIDKAEEKKNDN